MTKITNLLFVALFMLLFSFSVSAQSISGSLADTTNKKSIPNAVVAILKPVDSILYKFVRTDKEGAFDMKSKALDVVEQLIDDWSGAYHGTPEDQVDALYYLADVLDIIRKLETLHARPRETWPEAFHEFYKTSPHFDPDTRERAERLTAAERRGRKGLSLRP